MIADAQDLVASHQWSTEAGSWLRGDLIQVLSYPLGSEQDPHTSVVPVTVAPVFGHPRDLCDVVIELTSADGSCRTVVLDRNGHAIFTAVPRGEFQLRFPAPSTDERPERGTTHIRKGPRGEGRARGRRVPHLTSRTVLLALAVTVFAVGVRWVSPGSPALASAPFESNCGGSGGRLVVAAGWRGTEQDNFAKVLELFHEKTGVKTLYSYATRDIATTLRTRLDKGCPPDVALLPQPGLLRDLAHRRELIPIETVVGAAVDANYDQVWRELGSYRNTLYGVWFKGANKSMIWYNAEVFAAADVQVPTSWEDLLEVAKKIRERTGLPPFAIAGKDGWTLTDWFENIYLATAGASLYNQLAKHQIAWTHPSVQRAFGYLAELFASDDWMAGGRSGALEMTYEESVRVTFAKPPEAAMVYEGDYVAGLVPEAGSEVGRDARYFDFPRIGTFDPPVVAGAKAGGGDVAVLLSNTKAAKELIQFLATPEAAVPWARAGGFSTPNKGLDLTIYPAEQRPSAEALTNGANFQFDLSDLQSPVFGATTGEGQWQLFQDLLRNPNDIGGVTQRLEMAAQAHPPRA